MSELNAFELLIGLIGLGFGIGIGLHWGLRVGRTIDTYCYHLGIKLGGLYLKLREKRNGD